MYSRRLYNILEDKLGNKMSRKIYFYDVGVRNMVIGNFTNLDLRQDQGVLWENFLVAERLKQNAYNRSLAKMYFWRTVRQQEIDFVEEESGNLSAFEFKWKTKRKIKTPKPFMETYNTEAKIIDRNNFREFVMS